jgi:hypothetical protein
MPRALLLAGLLAAAAPAAAAETPRNAIHLCATGDDEARGLPALERACPGVAAAADTLGVTPLLSPETAQHLTAEGLEAATDLATPRPEHAAPDPRTLAAALASLRATPAAPTLWSRFLDWVRAHFGHREAAAAPNWFARWLDSLHIAASTLQLVLDVLIGLVIVAAGWVVYRELQAAGLLRWPAAAAPAGSEPAGPAATAEVADGEPRPAGDRVGTLFRLVLGALAERRHVAVPRSRTHRQLRESLQLGDAAAEQRFAQLATVAEEELYGAVPVGGERLERALAEGRALHASLAGRAGARS